MVEGVGGGRLGAEGKAKWRGGVEWWGQVERWSGMVGKGKGEEVAVRAGRGGWWWEWVGLVESG